MLAIVGLSGAACAFGKLAADVSEAPPPSDDQPQTLGGADGAVESSAPIVTRGDCHAKVSTLAIAITGASTALAQSDGTTLVGGVHVPGNTPLVARVRSDGSLDSTFGPGGAIAISPQNPSGALADSVSGSVALWRNAVGDPIVTFIMTDLNRGGMYPGALGLHPTQAKNVPAPVGPQFQTAGYDSPGLVRLHTGFALLYWAPQLTLLRLDDSLSPDASFGTAGTLTLAPSQPKSGFSPLAIAEDSQGRILVAADDFTHITIVRLLANGSPDPTFGANGVYTYDDSVFTTPNVFTLGITVDAVDRPLVTLIGRRHDTDGLDLHTGIVRLDTSGKVDSSFGSGGVVQPDVIPELGLLANVERLIPRTDHTTVLYGTVAQAVEGGPPTPPRGFFARLDESGAFDPTFGAGGVCTLDFDGVPDVSGDTLVAAGVGPQEADGFNMLPTTLLARIDVGKH